MSHELLGDVLRTGDASARARRWYVLPLSITMHAAAAAAVLIIPVAAEVELPVPARISGRYINVMPAVVPPSPPVLRGAVASVRNSAPTQAPSVIEPEKDVPISAIGSAEVPSMLGFPSGIDVGQLGVPSTVVAIPSADPEPQPIRRVGGAIREPRRIVDVAPIYPSLAIAAKKEGVVILEAVIDERGHVVRLKVLRSEPLLDAAAISAVERWRYTPTLLNNVPVPVLMTITVRFSLR